jgi:predicted DNA-binding transcriptional regulator YafY
MRKAARRESAKAWLASGGQVTVKTYAKRYGVDRYTAREDLEAIGFVFAPGDTRWSVRPEPAPRVARADMDTGQDPEVCWVGGRLMFVVGYTPGGAPYGCYADEMEDPF